MPHFKEPLVCRYRCVVNGSLHICGLPAVYRQNSIRGFPLCKEHGEIVKSYGRRVVEWEEPLDESRR
jgi:hypothetical protein